MKRSNFPNRKATRQADAATRAEARAKRSTKQQLAKLDTGNYVAKRERARLKEN